MSQRLANMETSNTTKRLLDTTACMMDENNACVSMNREGEMDLDDSQMADPPEPSYKFSFEQDLLSSRVYAKIAMRQLSISPPSSNAPSVRRSLLSDTSLADISKLSILSLPISRSEIWNCHHYVTEVSSRKSMDGVFQHIESTLEGSCLRATSVAEDKLRCLPRKILLLGMHFIVRDYGRNLYIRTYG